MKILSPDITHKSDVGGVASGSSPWMRCAPRRRECLLVSPGTVPAPTSPVSPCSEGPTAHGPRVDRGMTTDAQFGPVMLFGRGGTAVEVIGDRTVALPPMDMVLARHMISRTQIFKCSRAIGPPAGDLDAIAG